MAKAWRQLGRRVQVLLSCALVYSAGLLLGAGTIPFYGGTTSQTLVQANGVRALIILACPLLGTLVFVAHVLLRLRRARGDVGLVVYVVMGVLSALCLVSLESIGLFVLPVPILLWSVTRLIPGFVAHD